MKRVLFVFLGSLFFFASCKKQPISKVEVAARTTDLQSQFERSQNAVFSDTLTAIAAKELQSWNSYFLFSRFVKEHFSTVSASQALELSQELLDVVSEMKDSLKLPVLKTKSMYARIACIVFGSLSLERHVGDFIHKTWRSTASNSKNNCCFQRLEFQNKQCVFTKDFRRRPSF